jgi:hypothetical protein
MIAATAHRPPSPRLVRKSRQRARRREPRTHRTDAGRVALARQVLVWARRQQFLDQRQLLASLDNALR